MTIRIYERTLIQEFTLASVAKDSTGGGPLDFLEEVGQEVFNGILRNVSIACDSTDFDVSIRTKSNAQADSVDEIYRVTDISKYRSDDDLYQAWVNDDPTNTSKLYLVLVNNDLVRATGSITVKITTDINNDLLNILDKEGLLWIREFV